MDIPTSSMVKREHTTGLTLMVMSFILNGVIVASGGDLTLKRLCNAT